MLTEAKEVAKIKLKTHDPSSAGGPARVVAKLKEKTNPPSRFGDKAAKDRARASDKFPWLRTKSKGALLEYGMKHADTLLDLNKAPDFMEKVPIEELALEFEHRSRESNQTAEKQDLLIASKFFTIYKLSLKKFLAQ